MFRVFLGASCTFVGGAILIWIWSQAMGPLIETIDGLSGPESQHAEWFATTVEWLPFIVLLSLLVMIIVGAISHRSATGVR